MTRLKRIWCAFIGHKKVTIKTPVLAGTKIICPRCGKLLIVVESGNESNA